MKHQAPLVLLILFARVLRADDNPADCPMHKEHATSPAPPPAKAAEVAASPYVERQDRGLKALSDDQIEGYTRGRGMGLALPAELRHYPGPRHVLDAKRDLSLTVAQSLALEAVYGRMDESARRLGAAYVAAERELDTFFEHGGTDSVRLADLTRRSGVLFGELRAAHLAAHLETRALLSPEQIAAYDRMRGYGGGAAGHAPSHH